MKLQLFNSMTKKKEVFTHSRNVEIYVCGITPYDTTHLGHAFVYTFFDVLVRYLSYKGYKVTYVQNITDIDDDIIKKAKETGMNWMQLGTKWTQQYLDDMKDINNARPDVLVKATDYIPKMIKIIQVLLERGLAYEKSGSVYFSVEKFKDLGKLSKLPVNKMLPVANQRGNNPKDPNKKNPLDFVLWRARKNDEPFWNSPWGKGRPGWHIECSTMAIENLGPTIDIHGGGKDLQFPHHEFEIAQSENYTGKKFVRFWIHVAMLRYNRKKMSKSLGNLVMVSSLLRKYSPNALRIMLLLHYYRSSWNYTERKIKAAQMSDDLFKKVFSMKSGNKKAIDISPFRKRFFDSLNDDMDTPHALKTLIGLSNKIIRSKTTNLTESNFFLKEAFKILGLVYGDYHGRNSIER